MRIRYACAAAAYVPAVGSYLLSFEQAQYTGRGNHGNTQDSFSPGIGNT
jgi:hypothetical protein